MQEKLLKQYVELEAKFREMELEKKELRASIVKDMGKHGLDKVDSEWGSFTVASKSNYVYSKVVTALADKLALAKAKEVKSGKAKVDSVTEYMVFKPLIKE